MCKLEQTKNYYNGIAKGYPELYHEEQKNKINLIKQYLPKRGILLDAGAGAGILNQFLDSNIDLISYDLSEQLLSLNNSKNKFQGDISNMDIFECNYFNTICSFSVLQDLENPMKALNEFNRLLKFDGTIILSFINLSSKKQLIENFINSNFKIIERLIEEKDIIFILKKKY